MDNSNLYKFKEQAPMDYLGFLFMSFIIIPYFYKEIPENIINLILKYKDNPEALLDNQEIKDFAYSKYNEMKEVFNKLKQDENSKILEG